MGVDYRSLAIIGVKVDRVTARKKTRGCAHPEKECNFCPECGKKMWEIGLDLHPLLNNIDESGFQYYTDCDCEHYFIGRYLASSESNRSSGGSHMAKLDTLDISSLQYELKGYLGDLYKEFNFGLWAMLDVG